MAEAPAFLVYLCGHLRTFPLLLPRQRQQWDELADGRAYLIFIHTFDEIDHRNQVWWRDAGPLKPALRRINVSAVIDEAASGVLRPRLVGSIIEPHPGLRRMNVSRDDAYCKRGDTCVSNSAVQLQELASVHALATRYMQSLGTIGRRRLDALPVIRSRPDVTLQTRVPDGHTASKATFGAVDPIGPLIQKLRDKEHEGDGTPCLLGYRGPWWGGWGDIVWAARFSTITRLVANVPRLSAILAQPPRPVDTLPPFNERVSAALRDAHASRKYRAELVWMHFLRALEVRPVFWHFCAVARYRLQLHNHTPAIGEVQLHSCH